MDKKTKPYIVTNPQIEAMARVIAKTEKIALDAHCGLPSPRMYATDLYRKGYGKREIGTWLTVYKNDIASVYECSCCKHLTFATSDFCICGAKMGGE
jgi:hypothetical protein